MKRSKKIKSYDQNTTIASIEFGGLEEAYNHFNTTLFEGELYERVALQYQRRANSKGYFSPDRFSRRSDKLPYHEIALNPDTFIERTDAQICSTLAHEMTHLWQQQNGRAARGYHNKEWAAKMKSIGLQPSSTGAVGGRETGQRVSHYIIPGGKFEKAFDKLAATNWKLNLQSTPHAGPNGGRKNKNTFICPTCEQKAYGKPSLAIICKPCGIQMLDRDIAVSQPDGSYDPHREAVASAPVPRNAPCQVRQSGAIRR